ncbi:bleomycin resistance protein [Shimia sagamensis]|uniref:Bleomycin resistance protein n=1 Tax=Shimia sagamensis TaxID=1566352 RepID=A0ABY1NZL2_9RHOB|nr:VOC family protein [Shimia sagamensis]SMP22752.1 Glyoxalase/Bleomycin resistance protein/Dioxygenase superfamily protein [Shimia sagamensis]
MSKFGLKQITPFLPCSTLARQISFYCEALGLEVGFAAENYAFLQCGAVAVRLIEVDPGNDLKGRETSHYIDVKDIDALFADMQEALSGLPDERVRAPFDQPYGQREFHVLENDGNLVFFGEAIAA